MSARRSPVRFMLAVALGVEMASPISAAAAARCNPNSCIRTQCVIDKTCGGLGSCMANQGFSCADGTAIGDPLCLTYPCASRCEDYQPVDRCTVDLDCPSGLGEPEICGNGYDDDFDGCADEGCELTFYDDPRCTCTSGCEALSCSPAPPAKCDPRKPEPDECGDGKDDNCDGVPDDGCYPPLGGGGGPPGPPAPGPKPHFPPETCPTMAGADPIMLASRAAATEPFADFSAEALTTLAITRTYDSADVSLRGGPVGPFGRGWHHDWEATLTCSASGRICNVALGLLPGYQFQKAETALSLDGTEAWEIYRPTTSPSENRNVLVHRPGGLWSLYFAAGRELDFATVCDACGVPDAFCADPLAGGTARVVRAVGTRGEVVHIAYDRPSGLLIGLSDDLGHALEARTTAACTDGLARELRYDGSLVATYTYEAYDLLRAADADGATLRSYAYETTGSGLLLAVLNEAGDPVAEFSYDAQGLATGVHDGQSSVGIAYPATGAAEVTEYFGSSRSSTARRQLDEYGHILSVSEGCACGPAQTFSWSGGSMFCSIDSLGHVTWQEFDPLGRLTRRAEFKGTCKAPASSLLEIRDERRTYGLSRAIAQGVSIDLDPDRAVGPALAE